MKTPEELRAKLVQLMQEYQKNMATLLEHPEWFRMKGKGSKGTYEAKNSLHEGGSTEPQVDLLEVHTSSQDVEVSIEGERATVYDEASMMARIYHKHQG
jgi:hypothetical protein